MGEIQGSMEEKGLKLGFKDVSIALAIAIEVAYRTDICTTNVNNSCHDELGTLIVRLISKSVDAFIPRHWL